MPTVKYTVNSRVLLTSVREKRQTTFPSRTCLRLFAASLQKLRKGQERNKQAGQERKLYPVGYSLNYTVKVSERRMLARLTSIMDNPFHPPVGNSEGFKQLLQLQTPTV